MFPREVIIVDDTPARKRPNENYPLTNKKNNDEELVFYYSRTERLAKAPKSVQALYTESPKKKFGFFRSLTATRPLAILFISIMILCAVLFMVSIFGLNESGYILGGNRISLSAVKFQGETIIILEKTFEKNQDVYTGLVDAAVSPVVPDESAGAYPVFTNRIFFSLNPEEEYRFSVPFEAEELIVVLQGEKDSLQCKVQTK
jgi:hypothetical protein